MGSPEDISAMQFNALQQAQDPGIVYSEPVGVEDKGIAVHLRMEAPSVEAIVLVPNAHRTPPPTVDELREFSYSGLDGAAVSYLSWQTRQADALVLYEVYYAEPGEEAFRRVSAGGILDRNFSLAGTRPGGRFRVVPGNLFGDVGAAAELRLE